MTAFQKRVLKSISHHECSGTMEVVLDVTGCDRELDCVNVIRACNALEKMGLICMHDFMLTDRGREALAFCKCAN